MTARVAAQPTVTPAQVTPTTITPGRPEPVTITIPGTSPVPTDLKQLTVTVGTLKADVQRVNGQAVTFVPPAFTFGLGERDVAVFDAHGKELGRGRMQYRFSREGQQEFGVWILFVLATLPMGMLWYDIHKAYKFADSTRNAIIAKTSQDGMTIDELRLILTELGQAPPGVPGLARTMMAFMLMLMVAGALFYVLSSGIGEVPPVVDKTLSVITTALTTVIAFYFGARTATTAATAASAQVPASGASTSAQTPATISSFAPTTGGAGTAVSVAGRGFGTIAGKVNFGTAPATPSTWTDALITVPVPPGLPAGQPVAIEVIPQGAVKAISSVPTLFTP